MIPKGRAKLLAVLVIGLTLAVNFPALTVVEAVRSVAGGTVWIPLYLFAVWGVGIAIAAWLLERRVR